MTFSAIKSSATTLDKQALLTMAGTYRNMAKRALALTLRAEFNERAQRYEVAASMITRPPEQSPTGPIPGSPTPGAPLRR